jgi:hypothetical protein
MLVKRSPWESPYGENAVRLKWRQPKLEESRDFEIRKTLGLNAVGASAPEKNNLVQTSKISGHRGNH